MSRTQRNSWWILCGVEIFSMPTKETYHCLRTAGSVGKRCMLTPCVSPLFVHDFLFGPPATQNVFDRLFFCSFGHEWLVSSMRYYANSKACPDLYVTGSNSILLAAGKITTLWSRNCNFRTLITFVWLILKTREF